MPMFRKRPVVVEAWQWDGTIAGGKTITAWAADNGRAIFWRASGTLAILTLEGRMTASKGDWIIKGTRGEFYPCKPEIFADTYEAA